MHTQKLDDSVLVSNYIAGNERCLEILILRHKQRIFSFIYSNDPFYLNNFSDGRIFTKSNCTAQPK